MTDIDPIDPARLQRAYDRLPDFHAAIFSAKRHHALTYAEIAEQTGLTRLQVQRIFADALYRLGRDVREQEQGIAIGPLRRFLRDRMWDAELALRVWRDRL
ncbi:sigma factor-like helix-turn-helix DNA-binding protein [Allosphingosinicella sp.]|uniref:sigma factor-like helix-turn-helix DNA-binding protein n=1 Tax=Allosphingosinicella sp. TaxID=2823234 RepID=UPI002FC199E7